MTPTRLRPILEREHKQWIQEVMAVLEPAERPEAGPWARWNALRYLQTTFAERLVQERRLVKGILPDLTDLAPGALSARHHRRGRGEHRLHRSRSPAPRRGLRSGE